MDAFGLPSVSILGVITYVVIAVSLSRIALKRGLDDINWFAWIPFLNVILMLKIVDWPTWQIILICIPIVNFFFGWSLYAALAKKGGKDGCLTPLVMFIPILGLFAWWQLQEDFPSLGQAFQDQQGDDANMFQ